MNENVRYEPGNGYKYEWAAEITPTPDGFEAVATTPIVKTLLPWKRVVLLFKKPARMWRARHAGIC